MFGKSLIFILQVAAGILWIPDIFIIATIFFGALHPEWASGWFLFEGTVFLFMLVFFIWSLKRADVLSLTTGLRLSRAAMLPMMARLSLMVML